MGPPPGGRRAAAPADGFLENARRVSSLTTVLRNAPHPSTQRCSFTPLIIHLMSFRIDLNSLVSGEAAVPVACFQQRIEQRGWQVRLSPYFIIGV